MKNYFLLSFFSFIGLLFVFETLAQPQEVRLQTPSSKLKGLANTRDLACLRKIYVKDLLEAQTF